MPGRELSPERTLISGKYTRLEEQIFIHQALALPLLLWVVFLLLEAPDPYPLLLSPGECISLKCLSAFEPQSFLRVSCKCINLSYFSCYLDQPRNLERKLFHPYRSKSLKPSARHTVDA